MHEAVIMIYVEDSFAPTYKERSLCSLFYILNQNVTKVYFGDLAKNLICIDKIKSDLYNVSLFCLTHR